MSPRKFLPLLAAILLVHTQAQAGGCGSSCKGDSDPRVTIDWELVEEVAPDPAETGKPAPPEGQVPPRAERPMMVFVRPRDAKDKRVVKIEKVVLVSEQVAIGAKFFLSLSISERDANEDPILDATPDVTPRLVFLKRDYSVHSVLKGKEVSASRLLKAMRALVRLEYVTDFDKTIQAYVKLLNEKDRLLARREALAGQRDKLAGDLTSPKARAHRKKEEKLEREFEAWEEAETALLTFVFRKPKPAKP
ncbi:MAG: hypothetical protein ACYSX0_17655 [Planctomycetota bacterium]|jgi:hypothetical protein